MDSVTQEELDSISAVLPTIEKVLKAAELHAAITENRDITDLSDLVIKGITSDWIMVGYQQYDPETRDSFPAVYYVKPEELFDLRKLEEARNIREQQERERALASKRFNDLALLARLKARYEGEYGGGNLDGHV